MPNSSFKSFLVALWFKFPTNNFVFSMRWFRLFRCFVVTFPHGKDSSSENLSSVCCCCCCYCCCCCFRQCHSCIGWVSFVVLLFTWEVLLERLLLLWFCFAINSKTVVCISIRVLIIWFFHQALFVKNLNYPLESWRS